MKLRRIHIEFNEEQYQRRSIIETIFSFYAINGVMEKTYNDKTADGLVFNMYEREVRLMRHDLSLLRTAGYDIKEVRDC